MMAKGNKAKGEREGKMNPKVIEKLADMIKSLSDLCQKVVEAGDSEKYANSVEKLNRGVNDTYEQMRQIIINSDKFTDDEKLERLEKLAKQEDESKKKCDEAIKGNREQVAKIVLEVTKGMLTCGAYYIPAIAKNFKHKECIEQDEEIQLLLSDGQNVVEAVE